VARPDDDAAHDFVVAAAAGDLDFEEIAAMWRAWITPSKD